jgi:acetyl-CoA C-acetyltransferase
VSERCAVVGIGQTECSSARGDVSIGGLVREAVSRALAEAETTMADIDAIVIGKAPDPLEGMVMPELWLADALAATGKPVFRVHTAGSVGGTTAIVAAQLIEAGIHERVLTLAFEKQSDGNAMWALSVALPFGMPVHAGAGGYFAPHVRSYIRRSGAPDTIGAQVAVRHRLNGCRNPYAHLKEPDWTLEKAMESPMLWDPVRFVETCPSSDGAVAMVLGSERVAAAAPVPPAWIHGMAMRSEPTMFAGRNQVNPLAGQQCAADLYRQAGITSPVDEIDVAEIYVPFAWFEPMWLENLGFCGENEGWKFVDEGGTEMDGKLPLNPSGGVLCTNPIGASGMLRFAEAAMQVRGTAGEHQVDGARRALGHAYGGGSQFFSMWIVGADRPG